MLRVLAWITMDNLSGIVSTQLKEAGFLEISRDSIKSNLF